MIKRVAVWLCIVVMLGAGIYCFADEGMWLFNAFPKDKVQAQYGFAPDQAWLDHVRLSSARAPNGSSSFVSPDGLIFTNHHIAQGCIHDLSTNGKDYMKSGFYAATRADEPKCPGVEFVVLEDIQDVTAKVNAAVTPGMAPADAGKAQRAAISSIEKDCSSGDIRCDVVTLFSGAIYNLYKYKKYDDIRLVFAPEFDIAFFGGDPDNFEYPRYDLDISFFRAYENGEPAKIKDYLKWSPTGVKEGDLIFVPGHPGGTSRLLTMDQMLYLRDYVYPMVISSFKSRIDALQKFMALSEENSREAESDLFGAQNSLKAITGYNSGLLDKDIMSKKQASEDALRKYVENDPQRKQQFGDPWADIAKAVSVQKQIYKPFYYLEGSTQAPSAINAMRGSLPAYARILVRAAAEKQKPNNERLRGFGDAALPGLEQRLFSTAPIYKSLEEVVLTESLTEAQEQLGANSDAIKKILGGKSPADRAKELIQGTKLDDVAVRKQLYEGGATAVDASTDPLIVVMREIDPDSRAVRKQYEDQVEAINRPASTSIAKAMFAQSGYNTPPDATFTLRLSYGSIQGYKLNGKNVPWFTTMGGAYQHAAEHGSKPPYELPESWIKSKSAIDLKTPYDTVSTADIIGGNSGSPVINKNAEVVGIIFDGNIESLPWNFMFDDKVGRAVEVDSRAILESLHKIYHADALATELTGGSAMTPHPEHKLRKPAKSQ